MNVYDFDGTIFPSDCSVKFAFWCMRHHPHLWITFFPKALRNLIRVHRGKMPRYLMMREYYKINRIKDFDKQIERFWDKNEKKIAPWYLAQKRPDDLIISASASCVIEPIARRLGVNFAATEYDRENGVLVGDVMMAKSKARYIFDQGFPVIENFYSDSLADTPLALCAEKAHFVSDKARKVEDWPHLNPETMKTVKKKIDIGWNIHLER